MPCIQVGPTNTTLTIKGYGKLVLKSWGWGACIGGAHQQACGNIVIEDGTYDLETGIENNSGYAACIGSSGKGGSCGNITISGGNIRAESSFGAAAIGSGNDGDCGNITITGGTIYAKPVSIPEGCAAIGSGYDGGCGDISISGVTSVSAYKYDWTSPYCIGPGGGESDCGRLTLWGQPSDYIVGAADHGLHVLAPTNVPYTVSFNANGGTGAMSDQSFYSNTPQALSANTFIYGGKYLSHWSTLANGGGYDYTDGEVVNNLGNVTLYAQWKDNYTVHFDANGGTGTMDNQLITSHGQSLNANAFVRDGYTFIGWNTKANGTGTSYADGEVVNDLGDITLYAQWRALMTVSFNANGGTGTMDDLIILWDMPQALPASTFTRTYYVFQGWNTKADGSGPAYSDGETVCNPGTLTLYAQWTPIAYNITYVNATDGADYVTNSNPKTYTFVSNNITLKEPTRIGYNFIGWTYEGQDTPTKNVTITKGSHGDKTFTAHWEVGTVTLTSKVGSFTIVNGQKLTGTGGSDTHITIEDGATVTLSGVNITGIKEDNDHYWSAITCLGDATIILAEGTTNTLKGSFQNSAIHVPEGKTLTIQGKGSLTAYGNENSAAIGAGYSRRHNCGNIIINGGTIIAYGCEYCGGIGAGMHGNCGDVTITENVTSVTAVKGEQTIYTSGVGAPYSIGAGREGRCGTVTIGGMASDGVTISPYTYNPSQTTTCTVKFEANGGEGNMENLTLYSNKPRRLTPNSFTLAGSAFIGWNTKADGSGTNYADCQALMGTSNLTLYAQWHENFTVSFVANGGEGTMDSQYFIWNTPQALTANAFTREDFAFLRWDTKADGSGTSYNDGQTISNLGNTKLYAQWVTSLDMKLADNASNAEIIGAKNGKTCRTLTLTDRTLYKDGNWNTLCLPFNVDDLDGTPLEGAILKELDGTTSNLTDGLLTLNFKDATSIKAGKPYIIKWNTLEKLDITTIPFFDLSDSEINALGFIGETPAYDNGEDTSWSEDEGPRCLVDGHLDSKYGLSGKNPWVQFHYYNAITPKGYAIWTADDKEGARNPKSWTIMAKNDYYGNWTTLVTVDNNSGDKLPMANNRRTVFALDNTEAWRYFRFEATNGGEFQLAELQFCTVQPQFHPIEPETISTDAEWETFASNVNNGTKSYLGTKVTLAADINVSVMVGTSEHPFQGTFDGGGHTMTLNISDESNQGTAPFRYISGATIMNVRTEGTVTGNLHCAGLVGFANSGTNSIKNCEVAASVVCSGGNHSHCGGILGHGKSSNTTISDCLFSGSISGVTTATGIIYGWGDGGGTHNIVNCLSAGTYTDCNGIELLRKANGTEVITNCYRKTSGGSQGTDASSMTDSELAAALGNSWQVSGESVVPKKNDGSLPPIVNPVFDGVTIDAGAETAVNFTGGQFVGTYNPLASTAGRLLDAHNPGNGACRAALSIDESLYGGLTLYGWFTDAGYNNPATTIPFADDGTVILYPKFTDGTTSVAFAKEGYSTYYDSQYDMVLPAGVKARIVTAKGDGQALTYETIADGDQIAATTAIVPKATAVMLQTAASNATQSIEISLASPSDTRDFSNSNYLHGSDVKTTTTGGGKHYKLSYNTSGTDFGWYWGAADGAAFTSGAHKAWLVLPNTNAREFFGLPEDETTGVVPIDHSPLTIDHSAGTIYDLQGRKVANGQKPKAKGLYIVNGHKVIVK